MEFKIKTQSDKESVIKAVERLMADGRPHMWLNFLIDVQSAAIHLNEADIVSSMDSLILQSIALRTTDLATFFMDLIDLQREEP